MPLRSGLDGTVARLPPLILIFCTLHLPFLSSFALSIDDESAALRVDPSEWIAQGRWTTYLIEWLWLTQPSVVYLPGLLFGIGLALAYLLLLEAHRVVLTRAGAYILFALFAAFPTWFFIMEFYANLPAVGFGLALAALGVWCFASLLDTPEEGDGLRRVLLALIAIVSLAVAIGAYQSLLLLAASAFSGVMLMRHLVSGHTSMRAVITRFGIAGALLSASVILYYAAWQAFLWATATPVTYIESFVDIRGSLASAGLVLKGSALEALRIYGGSEIVYGKAAWLFPALVLAALAALIVASWRAGGAAILFAISLFAAVLLLPFLMHLTASGFMPYRSMLAVPYVMILCAFVIAQVVRREALLWVLVLSATMQAIYSTSLFHTSNALVFDHDRAVASRLYERIVDENPRFDRMVSLKVATFGGLTFETPYPRIRSSVVGHSFFEWDGGSPYRIIGFMRLLGLTGLEPVGPVQTADHALDFVTMPVWPAKGSVRVVGDTTLVRLSPEPGLVHAGVVEALRRQPFMPTSGEVLYQLEPQELVESGGIRNAQVAIEDGTLHLSGDEDPQILIDLPANGAARCRTLQLTLDQTLTVADMPQVFFFPQGEAGEDPHHDSASQPAGRSTTSFFFRSENGFAPTIRLDPGVLPQAYQIHSVSVGCLQ